MTRSPLTLAASVTAALPGAVAVAAAPLTTGESGRFDSAVVDLEGGERVVVRASVDDAGAAELGAESIALRALTPGVRALLPFRAPEFRGETTLGEGRVLVAGWVPGYSVDAAQLPAGPGAATSLGIALSALHALPPSVVRTVGLPVRTAAEVRTLAQTTVQRASATRRLPVALESRWRAAVDDDALWSFEPTVVLGDPGAGSFRFEERDDVPTVTGVLGWHALSVGDPAVDLQWLAAAVDASADVLAAYTDSASRAPDAHLGTRMRLYAELEFAKWLIHGHDEHDSGIVEDAVALLDALVDGLVDAAPLASEPEEPDPFGPPLVSAALAANAAADDSSTAMQTDAYDPQLLSLYAAKEHEHGDTSPVPEETVTAVELGDDGGQEATAPLDLAELREIRRDEPRGQVESADVASIDASTDAATEVADEEREAERASRAAFQRWASSASE